MSKKRKAKVPTRTSHAQLAREAAEWASGARSTKGFHDAPSAVPRAAESTAISLRMPTALLALLRGFAEREGVGYQVLLKRWVDDRVRLEREKLRATRGAKVARPRTPEFPLVDLPDGGASPHYQARSS